MRILPLWDFTKLCGKTSVHLASRSPELAQVIDILLRERHEQGGVSLEFRPLSKIISLKYLMPEITLMVSMALGTRTKFQLEILIRSTISAIHKFRENILESSRNFSQTPPWSSHAVNVILRRTTELWSNVKWIPFLMSCLSCSWKVRIGSLYGLVPNMIQGNIPMG